MSVEEPGAADLVEAARGGSAASLDELVRATQDQVYNLAIRMLWHPQDAEDATQEILIRVVTHLSDFRGDAKYTTWVYRIAVNYLLTTRQRRAESPALSFEAFEADLLEGLVSDADAPHDAVLLEEVKVGCTQAMLLCLGREERVAYVLGEGLGLHHEEAAMALEVTSAAYRKRLSRAREKVRAFMNRTCGWVNPDAPCRCSRRAPRAIELGRVDPDTPMFTTQPIRSESPPMEAPAAELVGEMEQLQQVGAVFRSNPDYRAPGRVGDAVRQLIDGGTYRLMS